MMLLSTSARTCFSRMLISCLHKNVNSAGLPHSLVRCASRLVSAKINKYLETKWSDGVIRRYPFVFLRDNCQCEECFDHSAQSRTIDLAAFDLNCHPITLDLDESDNVVLVWSDGHASTFSPSWLEERSFEPDDVSQRSLLERKPRLLWGSYFGSNFPKADYKKLLSDEQALLDFLEDLECYGFVSVQNVPVEKGHLRRLIDHIGFPRRTHYGLEFDVEVKNDPNNVAYTSGPLQLHLDLPYYKYKPGVEMLHCIHQTGEGQGGETLLSDGAFCAEELKKVDPAAYALLASVPVDWIDRGIEPHASFGFFKRLQSPILVVDAKGEVERINFSQPQRDSRLSVSDLTLVEQWYRAYKLFGDILRSKKAVVRYKMRPGEIIAFDNLRVLHGRTAYDPKTKRYLHGMYIDWDEILSRSRALREKLHLAKKY